ncbi:Bm67 [Dirofilaria immitis]|nr:Bm67 [Dirofilaria immitis]
MPSDRFKRKEVKTLRQRWIMKHKDRADDIPNCPSIESIINMPTPNEIPPTDKVATDNTVDDSPIAKISNDSTESQETTQQEISSKPTTDETFTIPIRNVRRHRGRRKRRSQRSRKYHKRNMTSSDSSSGFAIQGRASERRDDIPMCPDIENICQLQSELDDDMSVHVHRFSHALYQLFDDFFLILTNLTQFLKDHPRPATIASFIVASYLIICYLELSIAALIELIAQSIWPISHAALLFIERLSINFGSFMHSSDDIIKASVD